MKKEAYMILGGSIGQVPAIQKANELGFQTIVIDRDNNAIGSEYADIFEPVNTLDEEEAIKVAQKYNVSGSMTISSDIAVPTVCKINETLGLPNQGENIALNVTDKTQMRKMMLLGGVLSPQFFMYSRGENIEDLKNKLQSLSEYNAFIVKPSDSSGSRGVTKVTQLAEVDGAIENALSYTRNDKVIVEQFINGVEIGAQTFSVDGKMIKCFIHNDKVSANMIPIGHSFPYEASALIINKIKAECEKALGALGIKNGPSNIDIIITSSGEPYVIEIGARIGATKLPEIVEWHSGWDIIGSTILLSAGKEVSYMESQNKAIAVEMLCFEHNGMIRSIDDYSDLIEEFAPLQYEVNLSEQTKVNALRSGVDVYGFVICEAENAHAAELKCETFIQKLKDKIHFAS